LYGIQLRGQESGTAHEGDRIGQDGVGDGRGPGSAQRCSRRRTVIPGLLLWPGQKFISLKVVLIAQLAQLAQLVQRADAELAAVQDAHDFDVFQHFGDLAAAEGVGCVLCAPLQVVGEEGVGVPLGDVCLICRCEGCGIKLPKAPFPTLSKK
jgi:hypothetical protein